MRKCPHCNKAIYKMSNRSYPRRTFVKGSRRVVEPGKGKIISDKALEIGARIQELRLAEAHYSVIAKEILSYHRETGFSERRMAQLLSISKSEVHRMLLLANMSHQIQEASLTYKTEKYVLLEWDEIQDSTMKEAVRTEIATGRIRTRYQLKKHLENLTYPLSA